MLLFVRDERANRQLNFIYSLVQKGLSPKQVANDLNAQGIKKLDVADTPWVESEIRAAIKTFSLKKKNHVRVEDQSQKVSITDIEMPFLSMVFFMVKWAIASIPALAILIIIGFLLSVLMGGSATFLFWR